MKGGSHRSARPAGQSKEAPQRRDARAVAPLALAVLLIVAAVYWPVLNTRATFFDADQYVGRNALVQRPGWESTKQFLTEVLEPSTVGGYYQPLTMISLMLDYQLGARIDSPLIFRLTNLLLHLLNSALVMLLLYRLFGHPWLAAGVALLFGLHPITVEPVAWIAERKTVLGAFFGLLSLQSYLSFAQTRRWFWYALCVLAYLAGLMSKPTVVPLPALMLLLDYWPVRRLTWKAVIEKVPLLVIAAVSSLVTYISQAETAGARLPTARNLSFVVLSVCHNVVFYPWKLIWPAELWPFYPYPPPMDLSVPVLRAGAVGTFLLSVGLLISWRWTRAALVGWMFFFVAVFPTLGVIGFNIIIASDKYMSRNDRVPLVAHGAVDCSLGALRRGFESPARPNGCACPASRSRDCLRGSYPLPAQALAGPDDAGPARRVQGAEFGTRPQLLGCGLGGRRPP